MRIFAVYVAILFMLTPMIAHGAIENGMTLSDSEGVKIGEYEESTIVLDTIFDEAFESVIFEIESSSESEIITVMLYNGMFDYPANLNEYYILADAEPANAKYMHGEDTTEIEIEIEPGVTSVEIFGKIVKQDTKDATESMEVEDMMEVCRRGEYDGVCRRGEYDGVCRRRYDGVCKSREYDGMCKSRRWRMCSSIKRYIIQGFDIRNCRFCNNCFVNLTFTSGNIKNFKEKINDYSNMMISGIR